MVKIIVRTIKVYSIVISLCLILSINVIAFDNIVKNGDFSNSLSDWVVINSPQFSINVVDNEVQIEGDYISLWWDTNSNLYNGTLFNLSKGNDIEINIDGESINSFLILEEEINELNINPNFDSSSEWVYTESGIIDSINGSVDGTTETFVVNSINKEFGYGYVQINQTSSVIKDGFLDASVLYKHSFYNTTEAINSSMTLNTSGIDYTVYNEISETNLSWSIGNTSNIYVQTGDEVTTTLSTNHTLVSGDYNYTSKITSWDNCYTNVTSYASNGTYTSNVINASENCSWGQLITFTDFSLSNNEEQTIYFKTGEVETPDGTWSNWINIGEPYEILLDEGVYRNKYNLTGFEQFCQYKIEWEDNTLNSESNRFYGSLISGILNKNNQGSSSLIQTVYKPYTNFTVLEYDQQVLINDIVSANLNISIGGHLISEYNITGFNESINHYSFNLTNEIDSMGEYDLNFTVTTTFSSPNITVVRIPMDIVFALDTSGSMTNSDMNNLRLATKNLIGILQEDDRVAIFTYSGGGNEDARPELQRDYAYMSSTNKTSFNNTVDSITDGGYTPFYDTVGDAVNYTQINKIDGRLEYVIAITDGESNSDDYWTPETTWGNLTTNDPNNYDSDDWNQYNGGLKGLLNAPCIIHSIGLGISHDINYPSAPYWSQTSPEPSTGVEYDIWNISDSSPYLLSSEGGKYGKNETGEDNIGHYYYTEDSSDLIDIFTSIYVNTFITKSSGINSSCIINIDNVKILITNQTPVTTTFFVEEISPIQYGFYGTFTDLTLNENYEFDESGIESINIIVDDTFNFTVENITYIGNGVFEFNYIWFYPPASMNSTSILNTYVIIKDKTGLIDIEFVEFVKPTVLSVIIFVGCAVLYILIILQIFEFFKKSIKPN